MANKNKNTDKMWIRIMCGFLGALMVAGTVFMLIQVLIG